MKIRKKSTNFNVGDIVRIKRYSEIKETLNNEDKAYDGIFFNPGMVKHTDSCATIKKVSSYNGYKVYYVKENNWTWSLKWLE